MDACSQNSRTVVNLLIKLAIWERLTKWPINGMVYILIARISFVSWITKETFYLIFNNKIMNYELKSVLLVNLGFNII